MKKQSRPPEPKVLVDNSAKWNAQWTSLRSKNSSATFPWYTVDGRSSRDWILPALREMNQAHCSFCDAYPLEASTKEPIEHFKPKSDPRFYGEAYTWGNLYYCCPRCNETKGESWDDRLIAPDKDDYNFHDYFIFDFTTGAMSPNPRASNENQQRALCTIKLYGLDLEERRRYRLVETRKWLASIEQEIDSWAYRDFVNPQRLS